MPFNNEHLVFQWGGFFRSSTQGSPILEEFTGSLRFSGPGLDVASDVQTATAMALELASFWRTTPCFIPSNAFLEYVKLNRVDVNGHYKSLNTLKVEIRDNPGAGPKVYPTQVAWATTWTTDVERGKASRGRTYWPTGVPLSATSMRVAPSQAADMATSAAKLIDNLNACALKSNTATPPSDIPAWAQAVGFQPSFLRDATGPVASIMSKIGNGTTRSIAGAKQGTRLDIQRRRGENMFEEYAGADVSP